MNLNGKQVLAILSAILSVLAVSSAQLTDIWGPGIAKAVVSMSGLVNAVLTSVLAAISGQGALLADVQSMPGVDKIVVNEKANPTLASMAIDPANAKIEATPAAQSAVEDTAKNG